LIHFGGSAASSGYNDTLRIYYSTQRNNVGYNLAYIGSSANSSAKHAMRMLPIVCSARL